MGLRICAGIKKPSLVGILNSSGVCKLSFSKSSGRGPAIVLNCSPFLLKSFSDGNVFISEYGLSATCRIEEDG